MASLSPYSGALGVDKAAHLVRRATFRPTRTNIDYYASRTANQAVDELFNIQDLSIIGPQDPNDRNKSWIETKNWPTDPGEWILRHYVKSWWVDEAFRDDSIGHKLEFFLHTNFVVSCKDMNHFVYHDYLKLNRHFARGSMKELGKKMSINISMMYYLDGNDNHRDSPNENYAREFLELFSIGKGPLIGPGNYTHYTEEDVQTAARLFSGWRTWDTERILYDDTVGVSTAYPVYWGHDRDDKTFSSAFNGQTISGQQDEENFYQEIIDFVDMVFGQIETAKNFCRKLYRYFVNAKITPEIENDIITPLANQLYNDDYVLENTVKTLLKSQHFYETRIIGSMIKTPIDSFGHMVNFFNTPIPDRYDNLLDHYKTFYLHTLQDNCFEKANFKIFEPPNVAGYADLYQEPLYYRLRMTSNTIVARYKTPEIILKGRNYLWWGGPSGADAFDIIDFLDNSGVITIPGSADAVVTELTNYLFAQNPTPQRKDYFLNTVFLEGLPAMDWTIDWNTYKSTGDRSIIETPLNRLFIALTSSQEFQLM